MLDLLTIYSRNSIMFGQHRYKGSGKGTGVEWVVEKDKSKKQDNRNDAV